MNRPIGNLVACHSRQRDKVYCVSSQCVCLPASLHMTRHSLCGYNPNTLGLGPAYNMLHAQLSNPTGDGG